MLAALFAFAPMASPAQDSLAGRVAVVRNVNSPVSCRIAAYYASRRGVRNTIDVTAPDSAAGVKAETIRYAEYVSGIERPIREFLHTRHGVDFLVLTKGVPIRIPDAPGRGLWNKTLSVDSILAAYDYDYLGDTVTVWTGNGTACVNPFWASRTRYSRAKFGGCLVTRLDGCTEADAKALVDRALESERRPPTGKFLIDTYRGFGYAPGPQPVRVFAGPRSGQKLPTLSSYYYPEYNADMVNAGRLLHERLIPEELDLKDGFVGGRKDLGGYVSWGSNDRAYRADAYHSLTFAPGAICETAVSTSARTFLPAANHGQSLITDLISQGATGAKGYIDEPLLTAIASPTILFDRYTSGWTLAESYYAASRLLGWEDIVVGDPICRPYAGTIARLLPTGVRRK